MSAAGAGIAGFGCDVLDVMKQPAPAESAADHPGLAGREFAQRGRLVGCDRIMFCITVLLEEVELRLLN
jgi:hypothetical protein